jgi:RsiW-degrading membrane proteinase PrsW (M82 family)
VRRLAWLRVLLVGIVLYFVSLAVMIFTSNPNLFPTVVLIGNFLIPVTYVAFFYERRHISQLSLPSTAITFFYGGLLGVLASSILEPIFIRQMDLLSVLLIGFIEEGAKILGVLVIARRLQHDSEMDGLILGAAVGMGFAALESMGYAFTAFLQSQGSLSATVSVTLLRGILSPIGHGTWTAILASVLFRETRNKHFRLDFMVFGAYVVVSLLHAAWDGLPPLVAYVFSGGLDVLIAQSVIGGTGLVILWFRWRDARRLQNEQQEKLELEQLQQTEQLDPIVAGDSPEI